MGEKKGKNISSWKGFFVAVFFLLGAGCIQGTPSAAPLPSSSSSSPSSAGISMPLDHITERKRLITFGLYVTPETSPLAIPERFIGYHTGLDFEILSGEEKADVPLYAICDGDIVSSGTVSGYGGTLVESCTIHNTPVTVLYGHLKPSSLTAKGETVKGGERIALLGDAYSSETGGNRKHLHLDIHKGTAVDYAGYVQTKSALTDFIDPAPVLGF